MNNRTFGFPKEDWKGLIQWMKAALESKAFVNPDDLELVTVKDGVREAIDGRLPASRPHARCLCGTPGLIFGRFD